MTLTLTIKNRIQIPYIDEELDDFLYSSLTMPNPKYAENKRMKRFWANKQIDEELTFYKEEGEDGFYAPRGFLPQILEYCETNKIKCKINNLSHIFSDISLKFSGDLFPFQKPAIDQMLLQNEGTLCAPTGSGKTVMGIKLITQRLQPTLIIVHTKELLFQWTDRLKQFTDIKDEQIGFVGDGNLDEEKDVCIALIQTLRKYPEIVNQYSYLIIDECHRCPSKTFTDVVTEFSGRYITGLSATPFRRDGLSRVIQFYCGPILYKIEPGDLIESGHITPIKSVIRQTNFVASMEDPSAEYSKLLQELALDKERNDMIINDVWEMAGKGETCLILSDRKAHCYKLKELMGSLWNVEVLTGDTHHKTRKQIVKDVNAGKINVLVATGQLIGEGFDCKNLSALFLTMPIRYSGRIIQYLGRVLRPKKEKEVALVFDYHDVSVKCLWPGMKARRTQYKKLEVK